jgi:hypothetical protein
MPAGLVLAAMAGLWIAYLVPHWLRHRQQFLESRTDDRFSERLRVIRVARGHPADRSAERRAYAPLAQVVLHPALRGGRPMDRPHATGDRVAADAARRRAADHAHRTAVRARRAARARRRAVLAVVLLVASAVGWSAVGVAGLAMVAGLVPSALLLTVLVAGRRAALADGRQAVRGGPAAERASAHLGRRARRTTVGRAVRPSDAVTEVLARVASAESELSAPRAEQVAADPDGWVPVPVPVPAYTLKPAVRRAEPPPLVLDDRTGSEPLAAQVAADEDTGAPSTGSLDLDAVLARRRASGE